VDAVKPVRSTRLGRTEGVARHFANQAVIAHQVLRLLTFNNNALCLVALDKLSQVAPANVP
jgi:hypothetical protein